MREYLLRLYQYSVWANSRVLEKLKSPTGDNERARKLFAHILAAEKVWITRLHGGDWSSIPIWPALTLDECAEWLERNKASYEQFFDELTEAALNNLVSYKNSKGDAFNTPIHEILSHVVFHGTGHRGQLAAALRDAGVEPVGTDFIMFVRENPNVG